MLSLLSSAAKVSAAVSNGFQIISLTRSCKHASHMMRFARRRDFPGVLGECQHLSVTSSSLHMIEIANLTVAEIFFKNPALII